MAILAKRFWREIICRRGNFPAVGLIAAALLVAGESPAPAQKAPTPEYQLKAVFLFNFAEFVEWPTNAFAGADSPLVIGVLGADPFGPQLDATVRDEKINGRSLQVQRYRRVEDIGACHILFISRSESPRLEPILASLKGRSILTVSDVDNFASRGGMIRFVTDKNKIRLRINLEVAKAANLTISSKLLRPAEIVGSGKD
ncbi:MAG: YfiR family protein [Verrucomicrobia bacterium]|nr:MAG: YfiR family protein [Verrucomicrobiota bacterium]